jgi:Mg2+/Co2+ transporter CorB
MSGYKNNRFKLNAAPWKRGIFIGTITFFLSIILTLFSNLILTYMGFYFAILFLLIIVSVGILFDMIGIAVTAANEASFHAMASKKVFGAIQAFRLVRHADQVSSICNDVVGDICGTVSGAAATILAFYWVKIGVLTAENMISLFLAGLVAALTVGGKAVGKYFALFHWREVTYNAGRFLALLEQNFGLRLFAEKGGIRRR